jgi:hypothetical protein
VQAALCKISHKTSDRLSLSLSHTQQYNILFSSAYSSPTHYIFIHRNRAQSPNSLFQNSKFSCLYTYMFIFLYFHLHGYFPSLALKCYFPALMLNYCFPSFFCTYFDLFFYLTNFSILCFCTCSSKLSYSNFLSNRAPTLTCGSFQAT